MGKQQCGTATGAIEGGSGGAGAVGRVWQSEDYYALLKPPPSSAPLPWEKALLRSLVELMDQEIFH